MTAMNCAEPDFELRLHGLKPDIVFFDLAHWIPKVARGLGSKCVYYSVISPVATGYNMSAGEKTRRWRGKCSRRPASLTSPSSGLSTKRETTWREDLLMGNKLRVGVGVKKCEEAGLFTRESVCKAVRTVMEEDYSDVGREIRANRAKLHKLLLSENLESSCLDDFSEKLQTLLLE
ncbi:hypothetical protein L484_003270 [Morus notabilis]|uniref:Uncharacterized protein n=1 Tax=Morus notabilis TaxID=981085 RepID=W9R3N3_9ROSA|nr:hypothetical protein L484_003270 [Morus notabilis]